MPIGTQLNEHGNIPYYKGYLKILSYKYNMFVWAKYPKSISKLSNHVSTSNGYTMMKQNCGTRNDNR